jgi:hypothetical protein
MITKKIIRIAVLVGLCAAATSFARDQMVHTWSRMIVVGMGGMVIGIIMVRSQRNNQGKEK